MVFCTLFNSGYLDKGLLMYHSLMRVTQKCRLYVFAFDERCYESLCQINDESLIPISLSEFESPELLKVKKTRTSQEYCWTCSCHTIKYVLEHYQEEECTYIDADMYFYSSPECLLQEIKDASCDVGIIEHGMPLNSENRRALHLSGKYCVEFNTFFATSNGLSILQWWCDRCLEYCTAVPDGTYFGDQKYLDDWCNRFNGVHVIQNPGAGIAPWNVAKYRMGKRGYLRYRFHKKNFPIIFYHFQSIQYLEENMADIRVNIYPNKAQKKLYIPLYEQYLHQIEKTRRWLKEESGIDLSKEQQYNEKFSKIKYFKEDLLGERNIIVFVSKLWRIFFRKQNDYLNI